MVTMHSPIIHEQQYEYHSWEMLGEEIFELAKNILSSGQEFDRVIALAKGGLTFSRSLVDYLHVKEISTFQIEFYTGIGVTNKTPVITQNLPVSIRNEKVLVFDDIVDKGDTITLALEYLKYHGVKKITSATLVTKPWSTIKPDFTVRSTKAWVIFPNESRETIQLLNDMWREQGDTPDQIKQQLLEIGLPKAEVEFFLNLK